MSGSLYTTDILRLAVSIPHLGTLDQPQSVVEKRSPVCGSRVTVMLDVDDRGCVSRFAQDVKACALGQASAALLGQHVVGASLSKLETAHEQLSKWLAGERADPPDWPGLEIFAAAIPHSARHAAIRLPFEATVEAMRQAVSVQVHAA